MEIAYPNYESFENEEEKFYKKVKEFAVNKDGNYNIFPLDKKDMDVRVLGDKFIEVSFKDKNKIPIMSVIDDENGMIWNKKMLFIKLNGDLVLAQ